MVIDELVSAVEPVSSDAAAAARERHAELAKPPGSLGYLEELGVQLAAIARQCPPPVPQSPAVVVAAGDHGVHAQGVSDWPQDVTRLMVSTVAGGRAAVNAIGRTIGANVTVLDVGTVAEAAADGVVDARVRAGTRDITSEPAMTAGECAAAIGAGARVARDAINGGADLLATGDLGIGNTTASACLIAAFTGAAPDVVTGRGANRDDGRTAQKVKVVTTALERHGTDRDPLGTLASLGGLEHAALVGVILAGGANRVPVVLDGVIANAAALAVVQACPAVSGYLIAGHTSAEPGARVALSGLGRRPVIDLGMRLGEGTGALLAVPIVQAAARVLADMSTLHDVLAGDPG
jgi:nicotinate-nucleotide--dimethylbenzimidazole phosphoribosyltransferase